MATFRLREWFFTITQTATQRGTRFRNGDRPPQASFEDLFKSIVFRSEATDRAKDDAGAFNPENNGHVTMATGEQVKAYTAQPGDRTLAVGADQVTEVKDGADATIGGYTGNVVTVTKDTLNQRRNVFEITFDDGWVTWFNSWYDEVNSRLLPAGGTTGQVLKKASDNDYDVAWEDDIDTSCDCVSDFSLTIAEDIPDDADIVCVYDTSSFVDCNTPNCTDKPRTDATNLMETWYTNYVASKPNFRGKLIQIDDGTEFWLSFPSKYINPGITYIPVKIWEPDGSGGFNVISPSPITDPDNKKIVMIVFLDESATRQSGKYTDGGANNMQDLPNQPFRNDYVEFTQNQFGRYEFFRAIMYACQSRAAANGQTANLHSNVIQSIEPGTLSIVPFSFPVNGSNTAPPAAGFDGTQLDFIQNNNFYAETSDANSTTYGGLRDYGWSYVVDMPNGSVDSITNSEFNEDILNALSGGDGSKTVTITGTITFDSGNTISDSVAFDVPL